MQKIKIKNRETLSLLALATVFFVCVNPSNAFADLLNCMQSQAGQGIFKTMACKITTTLFDIRKIVYILGGFGLICFTYAAIFNKISFKHLGNIAFSLFLLSMITPFIEYFTQAEGGKLTYGDFLRPDFTEQDYSMTFGDCQGDSCPVSVGTASGGDVLTHINTGGLGTLGLGGAENIESYRKDSATVAEESRTGWQKFKDTIKGVKDETMKAYDSATSVIASAKTVYDAVDSTVKGYQGAEGFGGYVNATIGAFGNVTRATGAATSTAGTLGRNYFDKEGESGLGDKADDFFGGINDAAQEGKDVAEDLGTINGVIQSGKKIPNNIRNMFK